MTLQDACRQLDNTLFEPLIGFRLSGDHRWIIVFMSSHLTVWLALRIYQHNTTADLKRWINNIPAHAIENMSSEDGQADDWDVGTVEQFMQERVWHS